MRDSNWSKKPEIYLFNNLKKTDHPIFLHQYARLWLYSTNVYFFLKKKTYSYEFTVSTWDGLPKSDQSR